MNANDSARRGNSLSLLRVGLRAEGLAALISIALLVALLAFATAASPQSAQAAGTPAWVDLDGGSIGSYEWSVKTAGAHSGASASDAGVAPCILVGTAWWRDAFSLQRSHYRVCAESGRLVASEAPVLAIGVQPSTGAPVGITAVGVIAAPGVSRIRATLRDGSTQTIPIHRLAAVQARAARVGQVRYAAFAVRGWWCAERLVTLDTAGRTLWDSGVDGYQCSADGSPEAPVSFE